jgi:hypothetical protein
MMHSLNPDMPPTPLDVLIARWLCLVAFPAAFWVALIWAALVELP